MISDVAWRARGYTASKVEQRTIILHYENQISEIFVFQKGEADTTITEITAIQRLAVFCPDCGSSSSSPFSSSDSDSSTAPSVVADNFED
jgi:hypothetical protein